MINDGVEVINLVNCNLTKQGITTIAKKTTNFTNPVNIIIISKKYTYIYSIYWY